MCRYICTYQVACKCSKQRAYHSVGRCVWEGYGEQPGNRRGCIKQLKFESCTTILMWWLYSRCYGRRSRESRAERETERAEQRCCAAHEHATLWQFVTHNHSQLSTHTDTQWIHYKSPVRSWHANCVYALGNYASPNEIPQNETFLCRLCD